MENKSPLSGIKLPYSDKNKTSDQEKKQNKIKTLARKNRPSPRSFRISASELDALKDKNEEISDFVGGHVKITDVLVLRALIRLSRSIDCKELYEEIKSIKIET